MVTIASALDLILRKTHLVTQFDLPAILDGISSSFFGEFFLWTGFEPLVSCCYISNILSGESGFKHPEECLLMVLE